MLRWLALCAVAGVLAGCSKTENPSADVALPPSTLRISSNPEAAQEALRQFANARSEVFEGEIELFGKRLRARRQVVLDADGNWVKHGLAEAWYPSGQKAGEMYFSNNLPEGKQVCWHENGVKMLVGESVGGLAHGHWIEWYDNGQKQSEGDYQRGERHGLWQFWAETGSLAESIEYRGGQKVRVVQAGTGPIKR